MNKVKYITQETAILAKNKGIDQNPYRAIDMGSKAYYPTYTDGSGEVVKNSPLFNPEMIIAIAFTQAQLQTELRNTHKIDVIVIPDNKKPSEYMCGIFHQWTESDNCSEHKVNKVIVRIHERIGVWSTYEAALEEGLLQALKTLKMSYERTISKD